VEIEKELGVTYLDGAWCARQGGEAIERDDAGHGGLSLAGHLVACVERGRAEGAAAAAGSFVSETFFNPNTKDSRATCATSEGAIGPAR
jgi:hypothetical protein